MATTQEQIAQYESEANAIANQPIPQRRFGSGVTRQQQQSVVMQRQEASSYIQSLQPIKEEAAKQEAQRIAYEKEKEMYDRAKRYAYQASNGNAGAILAAKRNLSPQAFKYYQEYYNYYKGQSRVEPNQPLETPPGTQGISTPSGVRLQQEPGATGYSTKEGYVAYSKPKAPTPQNYDKVVTTVPEEKGLAGIRQSLGNVRETSTSEIRKFGAGLGVSAVGTAQFVVTAFTKPTDIVKGIYYTGKKVVSGEGFPEVGKALKEESSFSAGFIAGEIIQLKAPTLIVKASDVSRTIRLTKLEKETIIAEEFFKGQKYPQVSKGQTVGQLLEEFKPILPGETKPAGFTAAPKPLKGLEVGTSTSELPGLYQAPKLSATFLRVAGESDNKLFSLNVFPTLRPTTIRVTPTEFKLIEGVSKEQTTLTPIKQAQEFYKNKAQPGVSYVPFIKTEKEAILPVGTILKQKQVKYFFEFEGRKIPIVEFDVVPSKRTLAKGTRTGFRSASDISKSYKTNIRSSGVINPYSSAVIGSYSKSNKLSSGRLTSSTNNAVSVSRFVSPSKVVSRSYSKLPSVSKTRPSSNIYAGRFSASTYSGFTKSPTPKTPKFKLPSITSTKEGNRDLTTAYRVFVKERGKKKYLSGLFEKGVALRTGEAVATKTLRATFGVEATRQKIQAKETQYTPSKIFRPFKIKQGKQIRLEDTYIQKRGTRLGSRGEVSEILSARRRR